MSTPSRSNLYLGLGCIAFGAVVLFLWIPLDTASGIVEKSRGRYQIGDALAPTVAAAFILAGGLVLALFEGRAKEQPALNMTQISFISSLLGILIIGFVVMRYAGPLAIEVSNVFRTEPVEYRHLRTTFPWKYIGFVLGGVFVTAGAISLVERKYTNRAVVVGIIAVLVLILVYDVPFEDLLLPPNGDV